MTPSGFKPNYKYKECKKCNQRRDYLNEFLICNSRSSGNIVIDDFAINHVNGTIEHVPYNRFKDVEFVTEGGFSKIYKATWIDDLKHNDKMTIVLKELNNSKNINSKELNEVSNFLIII